MRARKTVAVVPVCSEMCATCPFRIGSPYAHLSADLAESALTNASRICHSTGKRNAINRNTGKPPAICRGSRDVQLKHFHRLKILTEPTDTAWAAAWAAMQT